MPELPDIETYIEALRERIAGARIEGVRVGSPFFVRTADPPVRELVGHRVEGLRRLGKRIVLELDRGLYAVVHLMIAGRLRYEKAQAKLPRKGGLLALDFDDGSLVVTEAGSKRRASLHVVRGADGLAALDPGGLEVLDATFEQFATVMRQHNHTLKRALTDPHLLSGIGNAFSDEILHRAQLSPVTWTTRLSEQQLQALYEASREVLREWTERLRAGRAGGFPKKVTAFRDGMAVHGRYREPCPRCGAPVQRIVRGKSEVNYCPPCQTGGKLLADRALSRLLRGDWPKTLEELEERVTLGRRAAGGRSEPSSGR
ncbi:MAG: formamidopyrimidine-DNA glycosylase [Deltaproteobacteria bacterium]|jgi:formamidopyrimidine-DNA glycosylase|nr:formamidopyrimidine-DNA glycosylase [Deltaproteobacteria bacterium]MBW2531051.1 formamidopyrimidine-DNA glycosylase [Deltaproteobacteria bacterium]